MIIISTKFGQNYDFYILNSILLFCIMSICFEVLMSFNPTGDEDKTVRMRGVKQILAIMTKDEEFRSIGKPPPTIQPFIVPRIKFGVNHYSKMIDMHHDGISHFYFSPASFYSQDIVRKKIRITVPPLLRKYSRAQIIDFIRRPLTTDYLCHSQPCERGVKTTTEATAGKMTYDLQLGQALLAERCREERPDIIRKRLFQ